MQPSSCRSSGAGRSSASSSTSSGPPPRGWVAVWYLPQLWASGGPAIVWLIVAGGILYTLGAVVYGTKKPDPSPAWFGFHEIFHAFTVAAWACHCVAVYLAVLNS